MSTSEEGTNASVLAASRILCSIRKAENAGLKETDIVDIIASGVRREVEAHLLEKVRESRARALRAGWPQ